MVLALTVALACDNEDFTGDSRLKPTSPTISVTPPTISVEQEADSNKFLLNVTMSVAQIVDVAIHATQVDGTATLGEDFDVLIKKKDEKTGTFTEESNTRLIIPAGDVTGTFIIKVLTDCLKEEAETVTLQFGDERTANADVTPMEVSFSIDNYTDLGIDVSSSWISDFTDEGPTNLNKGPTDLVDIDLYLVDETLTTALAGSETLGFESFNSGELANGTYFIYASLFEFREASIATPEFIADFGAIDFPMTIEISRCGSFGEVSIVQTEDIMSTDGNFSDAILAKVVVTDGQYEIFDASDSPIISGRSSAKSKIRELIKGYSNKH